MLSNKLKILNTLGVKVFLGIELEFYSKLPKSYFVYKNFALKNEIGEGQIEIVFPHSSNVLEVLKNVISFRNTFKKDINFNAFIKTQLPPSSMQFNVSIIKNGKNILNHNILYFLLQESKNALYHFAPTQNCKQRLSNLEGIKQFRNSPYTLSIGSNKNRTAMIRVRDGYFEHRLASPICKVIKSFDAILNSIILGLQSKKEYKVDIIHSNAFEEEVIKQYNLIKI